MSNHIGVTATQQGLSVLQFEVVQMRLAFVQHISDAENVR